MCGATLDMQLYARALYSPSLCVCVCERDLVLVCLEKS